MPFIIISAIIFILIILLLAFLKAGKEKEERPYYDSDEIEIRYAGNVGETIFKDIIADILHSDDILLNNIELNMYEKKAEIDNLVINKNGIFIIEVKNYVGTLHGSIEEYEWEKIKTTPVGNVFVKQVKNPIKQIRRQTYILSQFLKDNNIRIWIEGYAYFVNHNSPIDNEYIINDIYELEQIIHRKQDKVYDDAKIHKAVNLLSMRKQFEYNNVL